MAKQRTDSERRARQCERLARLLRVLHCILGPGRWDAESLANELECSTRTIHRLLQTLTVANVIVPVPNGSDRFPLSGTITRACTVTFVGGPRDGQTVQRTAVLTFNGTQIATMTVGDRTFDVDLKNRQRGPGRP